MTRWTPEDTTTCLRLLDKGQSYKQVAAVLSRSWHSVRKRARLVRPKNTLLMDATQVAARLGIVLSAVLKLIKEGYLVADQQVSHGRYYISRRSLEDFIRYCPERYDLRKIADPKLAALAASPSIRSDKLLTLSEAANILQLSRNYVADMARRGTIPGATKLKTEEYTAQPYRVYVPRASVEQLLHYRLTWLTTQQAATLLGYNFESVANMCRQRRLRSLKIGGVWYIDPQAVAKYKPAHPTRRKRGN